MTFPTGITAVVLGGGYAWISLGDDRRVMRVAPGMDYETGAWLTNAATELAYGAGYVWASVPEDDAVAQIDPHTKDSPVNRVALRPEQLVVARHRVFVASNIEHKIVVLSTRTGRRVASLAVPPNPYGVASGAGHVWATGLGKSTLTRIDF